MIIQFVLGLSLLVGVHELGHMLFAKLFGMRVEKFSIGFPPKIFSFKKGETEYSIGALPFGGFVKISGMVDESLDTTALSKEPQPWEFRSKPAVQRLFVMLGGIIFNVLSAIVILSVLFWSVGEKYLTIEEINKHGVVPTSIGKQLGFKTGDRIKAVNGILVQGDYAEVFKTAILQSESTITVTRTMGNDTTIQLPKNILDIISEKKESFFELAMPFHIGGFDQASNAQRAGLEIGDKIIAVDSTPIKYLHELKSTLSSYKTEDVRLTILRDKDTVIKTCTVTDEGRIGIAIESELKFNSHTYTPLEAIAKGTYSSFDIVFIQVKAFSKMFTGELDPSNSVGSFISIGKEYGGQWDWAHFWSFTATLSMILAFMNLLPIPALDGGHVVFLLYEIITRKKPSDKFLEGAQKVGMVLLFSLMLYAVFNDIFKNFFN